MPTTLPIRTFDRKDDFAVLVRSSLPHWAQAGALCFITFRTWDSLPRPVLHRWLTERNSWLRDHHIDPLGTGWRTAIGNLPPLQREEFRSFVSDRWEAHLDECHGDCVLRQRTYADIVSKSLLHFNEKRYVMTDFVVMPNHIHLIAAFPTEDAMLDQCDSWKHFTATEINRSLGRKGRFWEEDQFDHLVRSEEWFEHYRNYIAENPTRARLGSGEFIHFSKDLSSRGQ
jgi:REP element-mobilizing transposase RayT